MTSWDELLSMDGELTDEEKDQLLAQAKSISTFAPNYLALTTYEIRALCVNKCVKNSVLDTALSTAISLHMPLEMERINKHLP